MYLIIIYRVESYQSISVLSDIDVPVESRGIEVCYQIGKPSSKTQKAVVKFVKRKNWNVWSMKT